MSKTKTKRQKASGPNIQKILRQYGIQRIDRRAGQALADLQLDNRYQRHEQTQESKVRQIESEFNPALCQPLLVSLREDGTLWVVDGGHRLHALRRLGLAHWPCDIVHGLTFEQECKIFEDANVLRTNASALNRFKSRLARKEENAVAIKKIVEKQGFRILLVPGARQADQLLCVAVLDSIYEKSELLLVKVAKIVWMAWGADDDVRATEGPIFRSVSKILQRFPGQIDEQRLAKRLAATSATAIFRKAARYRLEGNMTLIGAVTLAIVKEYNNRLAKHRRLSLVTSEKDDEE